MRLARRRTHGPRQDLHIGALAVAQIPPAARGRIQAVDLLAERVDRIARQRVAGLEIHRGPLERRQGRLRIVGHTLLVALVHHLKLELRHIRRAIRREFLVRDRRAEVRHVPDHPVGPPVRRKLQQIGHPRADHLRKPVRRQFCFFVVEHLVKGVGRDVGRGFRRGLPRGRLRERAAGEK